MQAPRTLPPELVQRLADIAPPPPPDWRPLWWGAAALLLLLALGFLFMRRPGRPDPRRLALRRLDCLERDWRKGHCPDRQAAYRLAALLRLGLGLTDLRHPPLPDDEWQAFIARLDAVRYRPAPTVRLEEAQFLLARRWLTTEHPAGPC